MPTLRIHRGWGLRARARRALQTWRGLPRARALVRSGESIGHAAPDLYPALLRRLSADCGSVLDVGTGLMESLTYVKCPVKVGLDVHRPYLEHRRLRNAIPINADAHDIGRLFIPGAIDLVTLMDVIEHLGPVDAKRLLRDAEVVARRRVVVVTPRGPFPQEGYDAFGLGGERFQRHQSTWEDADLVDLGYRVIVLDNFHDAGNPSFVRAFGVDAPPVDALVAWKDVVGTA